MRADARRNYERLLDEARKVFEESGIDASLDQIAKRAGVASGTLYRHFPTRLDLIEAIMGESVAELAALGRELLGEADSFAAVAAWLRAAVHHALGFRGLSAAVLNSALEGGTELVTRWHAEMFEVGTALLAKARRDGSVTSDVGDADILRMVGGIAWAAQQAPDPVEQAERLLRLLLRGLR